MKRFISVFLFVAAISVVLLLHSCQCEPEKKTILSGKVLTNGEVPVIGAVISINEKEAKTDEDGSFLFEFDVSSVPPYKVDVSKEGYGPFSKIFNDEFQDQTIFLTKGTIVEFDPTQDVVLEDTEITSNFFPNPLTELDTSRLFGLIPKVYDGQGNLMNIGLPSEIDNIFEYLKNPPTAPRGVRVRIPGNSLVNSSGGSPAGNVRATLSTVDFFNPDGMPGDSWVLDGQDTLSMESFAAASIEIFNDEEEFKLKDGARAVVELPVYPIRNQVKTNIPDTMEVLYFNEKTGFWERERGLYGIFNRKTQSYEVSVSHFSVINMDIVVSGNSGSVKFRQIVNNSVDYLTDYDVQVIIPAWDIYPFKQKTVSVSETTGSFLGCASYTLQGTSSVTRLHPVVRLPFDNDADLSNGAPYAVLVFTGDHDNNAGTADEAIDVSIVQISNATIDPSTLLSSPDCIDGVDRSDCELGCGEVLDAVNNPNNQEDHPCNTTCWQANSNFLPFNNKPPPTAAVAFSQASGEITVRWVVDPSFTTIEEYWIIECADAGCPTDGNDPNLSYLGCDVELAPFPPGQKVVAVPGVNEVTFTGLTSGDTKRYLIEGVDVNMAGTAIDDRIMKICTNEATAQ